MNGPVDVVLSGGFLAFAEQAGFLKALEDLEIPVAAVCGTSSGALAGSLWAAGMPAHEVFRRLTEKSPLRQVRPSARPWRGLLSMRPVVRELTADLPRAFDDLAVPFGAGVIDALSVPHLLTSGPLPEAVAASCAIPGLFGPVWIGGQPWADGGVVDRTALPAWRRLRPERPVLMHWVESSVGMEPDAAEHLTVVRSPAAGAAFWDLGDVHARFARTREQTRRALGAT
ncbi:MAG: patatin-like phospholipase family protein [Myxococcales bacterium]|nr:patatin-like phospholipase family protein [Myxococcales bacterium]